MAKFLIEVPHESEVVAAPGQQSAPGERFTFLNAR